MLPGLVSHTVTPWLYRWQTRCCSLGGATDTTRTTTEKLIPKVFHRSGLFGGRGKQNEKSGGKPKYLYIFFAHSRLSSKKHIDCLSRCIHRSSQLHNNIQNYSCARGIRTRQIWQATNVFVGGFAEKTRVPSFLRAARNVKDDSADSQMNWAAAKDVVPNVS